MLTLVLSKGGQREESSYFIGGEGGSRRSSERSDLFTRERYKRETSHKERGDRERTETVPRRTGELLTSERPEGKGALLSR